MVPPSPFAFTSPLAPRLRPRAPRPHPPPPPLPHSTQLNKLYPETEHVEDVLIPWFAALSLRALRSEGAGWLLQASAIFASCWWSQARLPRRQAALWRGLREHHEQPLHLTPPPPFEIAHLQKA